MAGEVHLPAAGIGAGNRHAARCRIILAMLRIVSAADRD